MNTAEKWHGTTIVLLRKNKETVVAGDGQVSLGNTVLKSKAKKVRKIEKRGVIAGFAGSTADALTLFERLEAKLEKHAGNLPRAAVELASEAGAAVADAGICTSGFASLGSACVVTGVETEGLGCVVSAVAKTGVEMEAIMGVNAALITIYDLSKIVNPHLKIDNVKLLIKEGGKSGLWTNPDGLPEFLKNIF